MTTKSAPHKLTRNQRILKDISNIFKENPNQLFPTRTIMRATINYSGSEVYHGLKNLVKDNVINHQSISHINYYWLKRKE